MSMLFTRTATIPVYLVFALYAFVGSQEPYTAVAVLLLVAGAALTFMLVSWRGAAPAVAVMNANPRLATLPLPRLVSNAWPNSGYRNSGQRDTRGAGIRGVA
jgi:hypothetical protein